MGQCRGLPLLLAQSAQQGAAGAIGQVDVDQPQVVLIAQGAFVGAGGGIAAIDPGRQGFEHRLQEAAADRVILDQQQAG